jgi:hypothetical protein
MSLLTLFSAYKRVRNQMENIRGARPGRGIAVADDLLARAWQRCDRLERKLDCAITHRLTGTKSDRYCIICGWREAVCDCERGFRPPSSER